MLAKLLYDLLRKAHKQPDLTQEAKLSRGLHIHIRWQEPFFTLTIFREGSAPSEMEMFTCISSLPSQVHKPNRTEWHEIVRDDGQPAFAVEFPTRKYYEEMLK